MEDIFWIGFFSRLKKIFEKNEESLFLSFIGRKWRNCMTTENTPAFGRGIFENVYVDTPSTCKQVSSFGVGDRAASQQID
jgi:hypothetical protein